MLHDLYRTLIIEHDKHRRNYGELEGERVQKIHYKNPTCGDVMTLYLTIDEEKVSDVSFVGNGCSISMASASIMTELVKKQSLDIVLATKEEFEHLIRTGKQRNEHIDLGDALALQGVHQLKARHNCALMSWQALDKLLEQCHLSIK
ncbi:Fe-S cluster assembly sulfur transfer protein SufU [Caldalkalibacillus mannanilyticus]|uniref:Fe-S cluster assembly sulfur transfer protein SufU n=1 Tax=Caldalkalibacillus mannanilyticus TaxID=1418 RepID=UPI00046959B8|nr:SUF system NifU family Fe-S cluster assembly protein [Caldalkalibacillus mannanilyticus]